MPVFSAKHAPGTGVRVRVGITLTRPEVAALRVGRQPVPQPVAVTALIDTGAECSCVDPGVVSRARLSYRGTGLTVAPGVGAGPAVLGGALPSASHGAGLTVLHPSGRPRDHLVIPSLAVDVLPLAAFGIEAVIGRDVLAGCVLVYDGPAGSATLAY